MDFHGKLLSEGLVRLGHRVTIISSRHPAGIVHEQRNGVDIYYLPDTVFGSRRHGWAAKSVSKYKELNRQARFDLIWSQSFDAFGFAGPGKRFLHPPIVATLHGSVVQECKSFFSDVRARGKNPVHIARGLAGLFFAYFVCQRPLLTISENIVCVSPVVVEDIGKWFGHGYASKFSVIENGVDVDFFAPDTEKGKRIRQRYGIPADEPIILSLGRLTPAKGHQLAVYALKKMCERQIRARLIIAGAGEYIEALKDIVRKLDLNDRVIFAGFVSHDQAVAYYNAADVFVMPTLTIEGLPFVLLEAMSCGTPVIASRIGGNSSLLSDGVDGRLVEPGNIDGLAENIVRLINDRRMRDAISRAGRRKIVEQYSVGRMVAGTLAIMERAVLAGREKHAGGSEKLTGKNNRPLRILYIADSTSVHTQRWLRYFEDQGYDIYLITIGRKRQTLPYVHHVINFDQFYYDSPSFITTWVATRRLVRAIRPDILHAHFVHQYGWLGAFAGFHPFVLTAWGTDILELPYASRFKVGKWLTQYALKRADAVTVTSDVAKREAVALGALPEKVTVIFWGVDTNKFKPNIDTGQLRLDLNIPDGSPVILSNRSFAPLYNNDIIIDAMADILEKHPAAVLILQNAGGVPGGEAILKAHAEQKGVLKSVRFLPSFDHDRLPPLYALADIYVSVPSWDAGPVSLKEAMACGCAPVISSVPGPMEWVRHDENGIVVPVRDPDKLAQAVCRLLADPDMRARFNVSNRKIILENAGHDSQMRKVEIIYHNLIYSSRDQKTTPLKKDLE